LLYYPAGAGFATELVLVRCNPVGYVFYSRNDPVVKTSLNLVNPIVQGIKRQFKSFVSPASSFYDLNGVSDSRI